MKTTYTPLQLMAQAKDPDVFWKGAEFGARWALEEVFRKLTPPDKTFNLEDAIKVNEILDELNVSTRPPK